MSGSKRKRDDAYHDALPDQYFDRIVTLFQENYGVTINVKRARRFAADPRIGYQDAADDVTMLDDEDAATEDDIDHDDRLANFIGAADRLDAESQDAPIPEDFVATPPRLPAEILQTLIGRSLDLSDDQPKRRAAFLAAEAKNDSPDAFPPPVQRAYAKMVEAALATSLVYANVFEETDPDSIPNPIAVLETRNAPTFYGTTATDGDGGTKRQHQQLDQLEQPDQPDQPDEPDEPDEPDHLAAYMHTDFDTPAANAFSYVNKKQLRGQGPQGPHTIAHTLSAPAFARRVEEETALCKARLAEQGGLPFQTEQASWQALESVFARFTSLPDDLQHEIDANIAKSRLVPDPNNPGAQTAEKVGQAEMDKFLKKVATAVDRLKELYVEIDQAIQTGKSSLLEARDAQQNGRWTAAELDDWEAVDQRLYYAAEALVFEYKNMEPCATYAWNVWRKATKEELKGKGEGKVSDKLPELFGNYAAAIQGKPPEAAATARWEAMLDLGDYASKAVDGSDSGLDGKTLLAHVTRELSLIDEDAPELLTEIVMLSGVFPSPDIHGATTADPQRMQQLEATVADGTIRLADLRALLTQATQAGKFALKPVLDPLLPRAPEAPLTPEQEDAQFEQRLAMLVEIAKRRRVRLTA